MLNRVVLAGRLTKDPELRYTPNGNAVANFTIAINRSYRNQQGEQEADFINCVAWRNQAENLANYMRKGSLIGVDGKVQSRSYENQEGRRVFVTEVLAESITFLEPRGSSQSRSNVGGYAQNDSYQQQQSAPQSQQQQYQQEQQSQGSSSYQQEQQAPSQSQSNERKEEPQAQSNPFENDGEKVDIADDDLPF